MMIDIILRTVETLPPETSVPVDIITELPVLELQPLRFYIDQVVHSVQTVIDITSSFFSRLPDWVLITYGITVGLILVFYIVNKLTG